MIKIAPSILSADFAKLCEEIKSVDTAQYLHFDVMDGVFVPNISVGIPVLQSVRKCTDMVLDVHLMITKPAKYVEAFCNAGADIVVVHAEADEPQNIFKAIDKARRCGKQVGVALKPKSPWEVIMPYIDHIDMALVMTVEPGFGGQSFMEDQMPKISAIRRLIEERGLSCDVEVDGGVNAATAKKCIAAGANVLVAGSSVFNAENRKLRIKELSGN